MGYTFTIGNAIPMHNKTDFPDLYARWEIEGAHDEHAPTFPNDDLTGNGNSRSPSYSVWDDFCRTVGLYDFFYTPSGRLHAGHPGCIGITPHDVEFVSAALSRYRGRATLPPGFEEYHYQGQPRFDAHLARLIWLEWWMRWAVEYCETPAIENT